MDTVQRTFVRTTERKSFANCRQQWWWSFVDGWQAIQTRPALAFGGLVHESLAKWYIPGRKRGVLPAKAFHRLYNAAIDAGMTDFDIYNDEEKVDALELGVEMLKNYVTTYGTDDHINVISPELAFQVDMYDGVGRYLVTYAGSFDLVYEDMSNGQFGLIETKTAASINTRFLSLDEQAGSYWAFAPLVLAKLGKIKPGQDIDFILYNHLRKAMADDRPKDSMGRALNKDGSVSKRQSPALFDRTKVYRDTADRENLMERVRQQASEMNLVREGVLQAWKNPSATYPNQQCLGCQFNDICELHETGRQWEELARFTMTTWDPYEDHRPAVASQVAFKGEPYSNIVATKVVRARKKA